MPQRVTSGTPELKSAQLRALLALESEPGTSLTRSEYERLTGAGRSQAAYDLAELVSAGRLIRVGGGRSTRYVLAHEPASQRRWTPDRIRRELDIFCADRSTWPTASEFKSAGRGDLYVAASRYGGVAHWADELGLERFDRSRPATVAPRAPLRSRLAWGFAGAVAAGAVAAASVTAVVAIHHPGSGGNTGAQATGKLQSPLLIVHELPRVRSSPAATRRRVTRPTQKPSVPTHSTPTQQRSLVSEPVQTSSAHTTATARTTPAAAASSGSGPTPLPAPSGASSPTALKAP